MAGYCQASHFSARLHLQKLREAMLPFLNQMKLSQQNCFAMQTASIKRVLQSFAFLFFLLLLQLPVFSQAGNLSGKVTDGAGSPLAGATVKIKGTAKSTTTNDQGVFS